MKNPNRKQVLSSVYGRFARKQKMTTIPTARFLEIDRQSCLYANAVEQIAKAISEGNEKGYNTRNKDSDRQQIFNNGAYCAYLKVAAILGMIQEPDEENDPDQIPMF